MPEYRGRPGVRPQALKRNAQNSELVVDPWELFAEGPKLVTASIHSSYPFLYGLSLHTFTIEGLQNAHRGGLLKFFGDHTELSDAARFAQWLAPLRQREWVVYAKRLGSGRAL